MAVKFLLLVLIGVSLVQGQDLPQYTESGLTRAKELNENGVGRIVDAVDEVGATRNIIQIEAVEFVKKSAGVQTEVRETLRKEAEEMEKRARESQKPESAFQCIRVAEEKANNRVEYLTSKFKIDIERLKQVKLANIGTTSDPLSRMQEALRVRYERAVKQVYDCKGFGCVETAVNSFEVWLNELISDIKRVLTKVGKVYSNFSHDANNYFVNSFKQINIIKSDTARNIEQCV